jgi:hypothetical protein
MRAPRFVLKPAQAKLPSRTACFFLMQTSTKFISGYRGLWFELGQKSLYGDKYSGGLGTYTSSHMPLAVYASTVEKTFFTYGGTPAHGERHLLIMVGCYDHRNDVVSRPTLVMDKEGVDDPHDNASLNIDAQGYLWVWVSGRARIRPGALFRSREPFDSSHFEQIDEGEWTYPQPHYFATESMLLGLTRYTAPRGGRELYWQKPEEEPQLFAAMEGHYQCSAQSLDGTIGTFFNRHPGGNVDLRTDLFYAQTRDRGHNWETVSGKTVELPLRDPNNPARVFDFAAQNQLMYVDDITFDARNRPHLLFVTSSDAKPGPGGEPRALCHALADGGIWKFQRVAPVNHNYSTGALSRDATGISIMAPALPGPNQWGGGGEVGLWKHDGYHWNLEQQGHARQPVQP